MNWIYRTHSHTGRRTGRRTRKHCAFHLLHFPSNKIFFLLTFWRFVIVLVWIFDRIPMPGWEGKITFLWVEICALNGEWLRRHCLWLNIWQLFKSRGNVRERGRALLSTFFGSWGLNVYFCKYKIWTEKFKRESREKPAPLTAFETRCSRPIVRLVFIIATADIDLLSTNIFTLSFVFFFIILSQIYSTISTIRSEAYICVLYTLVCFSCHVLNTELCTMRTE